MTHAMMGRIHELIARAEKAETHVVELEAENVDMRQCLRYVGESFAPGRGPRETAESVCALIRGLIGHVAEFEAKMEGVRNGVCALSGPGRGDCEYFVGLPGESIPGQHDGPDDRNDCYGKPNGWCQRCWDIRQLNNLQTKVAELEGRHGVAPMAVACGLEPDATLDELYERMQSLVAIKTRVTELEHTVRGKDQRIRELEVTVASLNRSACRGIDQTAEVES